MEVMGSDIGAPPVPGEEKEKPRAEVRAVNRSRLAAWLAAKKNRERY
jgi:hypothetical protein